MVVAVPLFVRGDVGAAEPRLAALDPRVRLGQVDPAGSDRLDLGSGQRDARLERLLDGVFVAGASVDGDGLSGI